MLLTRLGVKGTVVSSLNGIKIHDYSPFKNWRTKRVTRLKVSKRKNLSCWSFFSLFPPSIFFLACLVCLQLYPINVKTAEPIGSKFCVGAHRTPGKVYDKIRYSLLLKVHIQVIMLRAKNLQLFLYCLNYMYVVIAIR